MSEPVSPGTGRGPSEARSRRLQTLFAAAIDLREDARAGFLQHECADDVDMLEQLRHLLRADARLAGTTARSVAASLDHWVDALTTPHSLTGSLIGPYRLGEALGQGGMGSVYRAERIDGTVEQLVAIKFVRRELIGADTLHRFQLERRTLARLDHPHIARLIDAAALPDGTPYFVMELVTGTAITEYCQQHRLDLRSRLQLFFRVCAAVSHAHRNLVVHCDLKPGNILVNGEGIPKLLDFGIAKSLQSGVESATNQSGPAQRFFSPRYAAPEQLQGAAISVGCDIYALGLLLYEMLSGVLPFDFDGLSAGQVERLVVSVPAPAPSLRRLRSAEPFPSARALRGDLDCIVLRCLRKAAEERYASVEQLQDDLDRYLQGRPLRARNGEALYRLRKFISRHRLSTAVVGAASLALTATLILIIHQNAALKRERDLSQQSLGFLKDAFSVADPIRASGAEISARQILDAARSRVDLVFDERPELYAVLAATIADVDLSVGRSSEAAELLERAVQAEQRAGGSPLVLQRLLIQQARALSGSDQLEEAQQRLQQARALSSDTPIEWQVAQGNLLALSGDTAEAIKLLERSTSRLEDQPPSVELANRARLALAEAYRLARDDAKALQVLDAALLWQRAGLSASHPQIMRTRMRRVAPLRESGKREESLSEALALVDEIERAYGADTPESAFARTALGRSLDALGRNQEAVVAYRAALQVWQRSLGQDHPNALRAAFNLAYTLQLDSATAVEAEQLYRQVVQLASVRAGPQAEIVVYYRLYLGRFLQQLGRRPEAFELLSPPDGWRGLQASSAENRSEYLSTLKTLYDELECAPGNAAGNPTLPSQCARVAEWLRLGTL